MKTPNFMIIGVAKAGTTSLFHYLDQHPQVYMCPMKASNFFGYQDACNWTWHDEGDPPRLRHFPVKTFDEYKSLFDGAKNEIAVGEASPQYLRCPTAAEQIHRSLPDAKLIASLRNPADRAFSGFLMRTRRGERVGSVYDELSPESSHVREGFYFRRLKRYFDLFQREQIKVFLFEDFKRNPTLKVSELFDFLEVDSSFVPDTSTRHNPAGVPRNRFLNRLYFDPTLIRTVKAILPNGAQHFAKWIRQSNLQPPPKFPDDLRAKLVDHYRDDILRLESLIDCDLSSWFADKPNHSPVVATA